MLHAHLLSQLRFGLRYDLFDIPDSRPFAQNPLSQSFKKEKNNFAPRVGFSWSLDDASRTVVRASTGIMYEPPLLNLYEDAILRNGDPRSFTATLNPTSAGAPAFPATLADLPPGFTLPTQSINAVAEDFDSQWALMTNVQIERAIGRGFRSVAGLRELHRAQHASAHRHQHHPHWAHTAMAVPSIRPPSTPTPG